MKKFKTLITSILLIITGILLTLNSEQTVITVKKCIEACTDSLIPSLFCFMVFSSLLIKSGYGEEIAYPLHFIFKRIIKMDGKLFSAFLLSQIGGYPVGIKLLNTIISQNKSYCEKAQKYAFLFYGSGPAFVVGLVGIGVYKSVEAGLIIFACCVAANLITAAVITGKEFVDKAHIPLPDLKLSDITNCIVNSGKALFEISLYIILFNCLSSLLFSLSCFIPPISYIDADFLKSMWEITNIKSANALLPLPLAAFSVSFGGICVIFQVKALAEFRISFWRFVLLRAVVGTLSAILCCLLTQAVGFKASVEAMTFIKPDISSPNPVVLVCIIGMTVLFLHSFKNISLKNTKKSQKVLDLF